MRELILRPYQVASIEGLRAGIRAGHRAQILCAPTGSGKTVIATDLMREAQGKGSRVAFVVDRVNLVDQTSAVLDSYGIDHGVVQAGHWRRRMYEPIQVCSAQTVEKRGFFPALDLLIVDECHSMRAETTKLIVNRPSLRVIGLTATPFTKGLGGLYSNVVNVTTTDKLIGEGYLVPLKMYAATAPDMDGAKIVAGEWSERDIQQRGLAIIGDIVTEWQAKTALHFGRPVKTIVFSATVDHGAELCKQFQAAGHNFQQISYRDGSDDRRREIIAEFRKPDSDVMGLVSCEVFTKGFDVPDVLCGIAARPYRKSLSSHIQQMGRVMRPAEGKTFALWLDHAGNVLRFQADADEFFARGCNELREGAEKDAKARKEPDKKTADEAKCYGCGYILKPATLLHCPMCGKERIRRNSVETRAGVMVEVGGRKVEAAGKYEYLRDRETTWQMLVALGLERKKGDVELARRFAQAQYLAIYGDFARRRIENTTPRPASPELANLVLANTIRYAKARTHARVR